MTTLVPAKPYTKEELDRLYPQGLQLQLVQILLRHGERSPVSSRFKNAGLAMYWPYCNAANRMSSVVKTDSSSWDALQWRRRIETFGHDDVPVIALGQSGEVDGMCQLGELTDKGRDTTLGLGQRLRKLYVDQLGFMPKLIGDADMIYLRATPIPRALESVQQCFSGMYPPTARTASFPPPTIITRTPAEETLYPNDSNCRRFNQLSRAFAQRTADRWNQTKEIDYLNTLISKWMPEDSKRVAVDSHPRLSGIMDTINSTLGHGKPTRLPKEFYDPKALEIIDKISVEEWFSGYAESAEYRAVGIGGLVGDVVSRMVGNLKSDGHDGLEEVGGKMGDLGEGRGGEQNIKFALSGCHDTTLAAVLTSFGAFEDEPWPPYTSHIAVELFKKSSEKEVSTRTNNGSKERPSDGNSTPKNFWSSIIGLNAQRESAIAPQNPTRKTMQELSQTEIQQMEDYYVRIKYNDRVMTVPGCKAPGNHLDGDDSLCTLAAFKSIADVFTPKSWRQACNSNLDQPVFPRTTEKAGY